MLSLMKTIHTLSVCFGKMNSIKRRCLGYKTVLVTDLLPSTVDIPTPLASEKSFSIIMFFCKFDFHARLLSAPSSSC